MVIGGGIGGAGGADKKYCWVSNLFGTFGVNIIFPQFEFLALVSTHHEYTVGVLLL